MAKRSESKGILTLGQWVEGESLEGVATEHNANMLLDLVLMSAYLEGMRSILDASWYLKGADPVISEPASIGLKVRGATKRWKNPRRMLCYRRWVWEFRKKEIIKDLFRMPEWVDIQSGVGK